MSRCVFASLPDIEEEIVIDAIPPWCARRIAALGGAFALVLASCGGSAPAVVSPTAGQASVSAAPAPTAASLEKELTFTAPSGTFQTGMAKDIIPLFERETGVKVTYVAGQTNENLAKVQAQRGNPQIDVLWGSDIERIQGIKDGLWAEFDAKKIPNIATLPEAFRPKDQYGIPIATVVGGIEYNTKVFAEKGWTPPTSWNDFWDPKYRGHVATYSVSVTVSALMLTTVARLNGGSEKNIEPGFAKMLELKPSLFAIYTNAAQMDQGITQGNVWINLNTGARTMLLKEQGGPVEFVAPKEGLAFQQQKVQIVKNAPHPNAAHAWVSFLLRKDIQDKLAVSIGYGPVNGQAQVPANMARYLPTAASAQNALIPDWETLVANLPSWVDRWNREIERK